MLFNRLSANRCVGLDQHQTFGIVPWFYKQNIELIFKVQKKKRKLKQHIGNANIEL